MNAFQPLLDALASAAPIIAAGIASALLSAVREHAEKWIKPKFYPVLLPIAGGLVASLGNLVGVDLGDFNAQTADFTLWQSAVAGVMTGGFMVGLNQIPKQAKKPD